MGEFVDLKGMRFGRLRVLAQGPDKYRKPAWWGALYLRRREGCPRLSAISFAPAHAFTPLISFRHLRPVTNLLQAESLPRNRGFDEYVQSEVLLVGSAASCGSSHRYGIGSDQ
jgi:hypothetical protein